MTRATACARSRLVGQAAVAVVWMGLGATWATSLAAQQTSGDVLTSGVPDAPAFTFLGVSPHKIARPSSPRDLGVDLLQAVDSLGHVQTGFALNATLWSFVPGLDIPLAKYKQPFDYAVANTQISLGAVRAAGDSSATDIAVGLRSTLIDRSDPMLDDGFIAAYTAILKRCLALAGPSGSPTGPAGTVATGPTAADVACAGKAADSLRKTWFDKNFNRPSLSIGGATGWQFARSAASGAQSIGGSAWASGAIPLGNAAQLIGLVKYDFRTALDTGGTSQLLTYGVRAIAGSSTRDVFLELLGTGRLHASSTTSRSNTQWSGGVEFQISDQYWLSAGFGQRYAARGRPDRLVIIAGMKWGISSAARLFTLNHASSSP